MRLTLRARAAQKYLDAVSEYSNGIRAMADIADHYEKEAANSSELDLLSTLLSNRAAVRLDSTRSPLC